MIETIAAAASHKTAAATGNEINFDSNMTPDQYKGAIEKPKNISARET